MSDDEITGIKVTLARIQTMLEGHFSRDDERAKLWEGHEKRLVVLEAERNKREGGKAMLALVVGAAATIGGLIVKFLPLGSN
jgi:hypothetical protein